MPLKDLLWACPLCHAVEGLGLEGVCAACGAAFSRGTGARIVARRKAEGREAAAERTALEWLAMLPWPDVDGEGTSLPAGLEPPFEAAVRIRVAACERPVRRGGHFLGLVEVYGAKQPGRLVLGADTLGFRPARAGEGFSWPLVEVTGIQPSSAAIQLKARGRPVVSVRFVAGSVRLWEQRLKHGVRRAYRAAGRGEIVEYQPWIRVQ